MPSVINAEDQDLLEKYYKTEAKDMEVFARHSLSSAELAEEAVQETFIIALQKIEALKSSPKPVGWLYNTLKFVILHIRRDLLKQLSRVVSIDDMQEVPVFNRDLEMMQLSDTGRDSDMQLLTEFYIEGRSLIELAEDYKITVGACKMRLKRARDRSKALLE